MLKYEVYVSIYNLLFWFVEYLMTGMVPSINVSRVNEDNRKQTKRKRILASMF